MSKKKIFEKDSNLAMKIAALQPTNMSASRLLFTGEPGG